MTNTAGCVEATVPLCPDDGAPSDQVQEDRHEAAVRAGGAAAPEHDGEDVRDLEQQARERPLKVLRKRPEQPTAAEVQVHQINGHEPYRSWCRACVAGRGRADAHVERPGVEKGVPIIGVDYGYLWSRAPKASDAPEDTQRDMKRAKWGQERGKKSAKFSAPNPSGPHPSWLHPSGPHFFQVWPHPEKPPPFGASQFGAPPKLVGQKRCWPERCWPEQVKPAGLKRFCLNRLPKG